MKILMMLLCLSFLPVSAAALEIQAPAAPGAALQWMPEETESFSEGLPQLVRRAVSALRPDLQEAARISLGVLSAALLSAILGPVSPEVQKTSALAGVAAISAMLLQNTNSMIRLAADTVRELMEYGKLLLPVMTAALAAQGGITGSAGLYTATAAFSALLQSIMTGLLLPGIYLFLALRMGSSATGENILKKAGDLIKTTVNWCLKILLTVFTTYLGLTGAVSGTTDAAALKAARVTISSVVPVVGGVLSDASEAVLVGASVMKNAAGIYGILAVLAIFLHPFLKIGVHYLILKLTEALCSILAEDALTQITGAFSTAMGLLLGITASSCVMVLISTVCFMRGVL